MKFVRFKDKHQQQLRQGILTDGEIKEISGNMFHKWDYTGEHFSQEEVDLAAPLEPNQVIGIGANYVAKKEDLPEKGPDMPVFFFKPNSSVIGPGESIQLPETIDEVKFESELAVVIGKEAASIREEEVFDYIFGYTVANDVTAPQYFHEDGHWTLGKSFDTFTPLGPVIETEFDADSAEIQAVHNGEKKQDSPTNLMIVTTQRMIAYLSNVMTLKPGDVILTGSPVGAEFLKENDEIECKIAGIGSLKNKVVKIKQPSQV
ncbi:fumarylacetoacetate hydrolase family protein [Thalassobacillus pellis]|uniref:fumarylacetoacetate hydrolase family protein n=1 Tax=Thalassobacillus pellis TaxID=748008 RepID=UPI001961BC85|nr:2-keto-4-pentenoate hydratase/2-oxohepta-3-ene-1,7-dioic acid hydratase in catechol pathway [Thalassobacillus pellis]